MNIVTLSRHALGLCAAIVALATSAGSSAFASAVGQLSGAGSTISALPLGITPHHAQRPDHRKSWMSPNAVQIKRLLYISSYTDNDVYVYNYDTGVSVGTLTGFDDPRGQCVDKLGAVWITNYDGFSVEKFAHGGTVPIKTLPTVGYPIGCSIDGTTGNLAVASDPGASGAAVIQVWQKASGSPNDYSNTACHYQEAPGYDNHGNLYVEGQSEPSGSYLVCELPAGGTSLNTVPFNHSISEFGSVMWDGRYITLTDTDYNFGNFLFTTAIYQATENPSGGLSAVSATILNDSSCDQEAFVFQPFIVGARNTPANTQQGTAVVGGNTDCSGPFDYWAYPAGGNPSSSLSSAPDYSEGAAVSIAVAPVFSPRTPR